MGTASRYLPAFSSSIAFNTSGDSVCARASPATATASATTTNQRSGRPRRSVPLWRGSTVDSREVVEDRTALVRGESSELLPRRRLELDRCLRVDLVGGGEDL